MGDMNGGGDAPVTGEDEGETRVVPVHNRRERDPWDGITAVGCPEEDLRAFEDALEGFGAAASSVSDKVDDMLGEEAVRTRGTAIKENVPATGDEEIESADHIYAGGSGIVRSNLEAVGTVLAEKMGVSDSIIGRVDGDVTSVKDRAISTSDIDVVDGDVKGLEAVASSTVGRIEGDVVSRGKGASVFFSSVGEIHGDVESAQHAFQNSSIGAVFGDIHADEMGFYETDFPYVVGDEVRTFGTLDRESFGGLVAADEVDVGRYLDNIFVLTPRESGLFTTYDGDWDELKERLREDRSLTKAIQAFNPDIDRIHGFDHLMELEDELESYIDDLSYEEIRDAHSAVKGFMNVDREMFGGLLNEAADEMEYLKKRRVDEFSKVLSEMQRRHNWSAVDVLSLLKTGRKQDDLAKDLFRAAKRREYASLLSVEEEAERLLSDIFHMPGSMPSISEILKGSPYELDREFLYAEFSEEIKHVVGLGKRLGFDVEFDVEKLLKNWEYQRQEMGRERDPDIEYLGRELAKELDDKQRAYTLQIIEQVGRERGVERYRELTGDDGGEPNEHELEVLKALEKDAEEDEKIQEEATRLLERGDEVYEAKENREWLDECGFEEDELRRGIGEQRYGEFTVRVADPLESVQMGNYFTCSCLSIGKKNGWGAVANAVDVNKQVLYVEDEEGQVRGRLLTAVTEEGDMTYFSVHQNIEENLAEYAERYVEEWAEELGVDMVKHDKNVETLVADDWYTGYI